MRIVRPTPDFFDQIDRQLPSEREEDGTPSRNDFESRDLIDIIRIFAQHWDQLPEVIPGRPEYRRYIGAGKIVGAFVVTGQLAPSGEVELTTIRLEVSPLSIDDPDS